MGRRDGSRGRAELSRAGVVRQGAHVTGRRRTCALYGAVLHPATRQKWSEAEFWRRDKAVLFNQQPGRH